MKGRIEPGILALVLYGLNAGKCVRVIHRLPFLNEAAINVLFGFNSHNPLWLCELQTPGKITLMPSGTIYMVPAGTTFVAQEKHLMPLRDDPDLLEEPCPPIKVDQKESA